MTSTLVNCIVVCYELRIYIALSWGIVALVLNGHSINMPEWVFYQTNEDFRYSVGLWKNCTSKLDAVFDCVYISNAPGISQLVGDVAFAVKYTDLGINNGHLSSCFFMTVVSSISLLLTAAFLYLIKKTNVQNNYDTLSTQDVICQENIK
ncbi:hypothetical protein CHS0354_021005 [Potamilus streckersoni]|uniref:Uncharacterized protein n=1 Tax=Potamilus streckersoni TaxID=2493646 RepID=A0AAE0RUK9_9BIVA|nr:hypothetical protein CHS0354_021005 [Potamilus streckersoni]